LGHLYDILNIVTRRTIRSIRFNCLNRLSSNNILIRVILVSGDTVVSGDSVTRDHQTPQSREGSISTKQAQSEDAAESFRQLVLKSGTFH